MTKIIPTVVSLRVGPKNFRNHGLAHSRAIRGGAVAIAPGINKLKQADNRS